MPATIRRSIQFVVIFLFGLWVQCHSSRLHPPTSHLATPLLSRRNVSSPSTLSTQKILPFFKIDKERTRAIMWRNIPNILSVFRLFSIPPLIVSYMFHCKLYFTIIFVVASVTDYVDGYVARRYNLTSDFGALIDPVADKLLVITSLLLLMYHLPVPWVALPVITIVLREIMVSGVREWLAGRNLRHLVQVNKVGKWKTATQMISLALLFISFPFPTTLIRPDFANFLKVTPFENSAIWISSLNGRFFFQLGIGLFYLSTVLTLISGSSYVYTAWPVLVGRGESS